MKKQIYLKNILGITVNKTSNEFVIHEKIKDDDTRFLSLRKNELLSTIAEDVLFYFAYKNITLNEASKISLLDSK